jgi:amino-acid N-acetyltransferase
MDAPRIDRAGERDVDGVLALLRENGLPVDGWLAHLPTTIVFRSDGQVIGCAALEIYADGALLRSVAVAPASHGHRLGHALTAEALRRARDLGLPAVYLLTTTAERFFDKFGFERIERTAVPQSVRASIEFTSACPSSATVMRKTV